MAKATADIRSLARAHTATAITVLASIMRQKKAPAAARVTAASALLDRGWGKPVQAMEHSGPDGGPIETADLDNRSLARSILAVLREADVSDTGANAA